MPTALTVSMDEAKRSKPVDINPKGGRLLVFDSSMVHSVEKVTQSRIPRRALTIWISIGQMTD
jgi:Rps23 Pro-64 3,4-dihydroxylase Tpa1-like proline 4-hydroxylase